MGAQIWKHKNKKRFRTCWRSVSKMRSPPSASTGPARKRPKLAMMASFLFPTIMVCVSTNRCCNLSSICFEGGCQERRVTVGLIVFFDALVCASLVRSWGTFSFWRAVLKSLERSWILRMRLAALACSQQDHDRVTPINRASRNSSNGVFLPSFRFCIFYSTCRALDYCSL